MSAISAAFIYIGRCPNFLSLGATEHRTQVLRLPTQNLSASFGCVPNNRRKHRIERWPRNHLKCWAAPQFCIDFDRPHSSLGGCFSPVFVGRNTLSFSDETSGDPAATSTKSATCKQRQKITLYCCRIFARNRYYSGQIVVINRWRFVDCRMFVASSFSVMAFAKLKVYFIVFFFVDF